MKKLISVLLCAAVLNACQPQARAQLALPIFVLAIAAGATTITIYIIKKTSPAATHTFVLQRRDANGTWSNIATNTLRLPPEKLYEAFWSWKQTNDVVHLYRIVEIPWPYEQRPAPGAEWVNYSVFFTE
jgi:hypothetical protein